MLFSAASRSLFKDSNESQLQNVACYVYLVLGLVLVAMSFSLLQEEVVSRGRHFANAVGLVKREDLAVWPLSSAQSSSLQEENVPTSCGQNQQLGTLEVLLILSNWKSWAWCRRRNRQKCFQLKTGPNLCEYCGVNTVSDFVN